MFLSEDEWRERLRQIPVHCCNCAATFHGAGLPGDIDYPLNVGICAACWRLIRRPNHSIVSENVSLREENERLVAENNRFKEENERLRAQPPVLGYRVRLNGEWIVVHPTDVETVHAR